MFFYIFLLFFTTALNAQLSLEQQHSITGFSFEKLTTINTQLTELEKLQKELWGPYYHVFPALLNRLNLQIGCEIGVSGGFHSYEILATSNVKTLFSIDPYIKYDDPTNNLQFIEGEKNQDFYDIFYLSVLDRLSIFGNRSSLMRLFSHDAVKHFQDKSLDFVFLDANHTYEYVKQDLELWYSKVRSGGIFAGDDYTTHIGVFEATNEFFGSKKLTIHQDPEHSRIWWVFVP